MNGLRICTIDIYAVADDYDYIIQTNLDELEQKINQELSINKDGESAKTIIRLHEVVASSSTVEVKLRAIDEEIDFINDTEIADFINDELVMHTKTSFGFILVTQPGQDENVALLENEIEYV